MSHRPAVPRAGAPGTRATRMLLNQAQGPRLTLWGTGTPEMASGEGRACVGRTRREKRAARVRRAVGAEGLLGRGPPGLRGGGTCPCWRMNSASAHAGHGGESEMG